MSVIVAVKDAEGNVHMACDSQVTAGYTKRTLTNPSVFKIGKFIEGEDIIFGTVGSLKLNNVLKVETGLFDELFILKEQITFEYMVKAFVPRLFVALEKYHNLLTYSVDKMERYIEGGILIGLKDHLFEISADGCVTEDDYFVSNGSGARISLGYLEQSYDEDIKKRLYKAVESACLVDNYVNYPIIYLNTDDVTYEVLEYDMSGNKVMQEDVESDESELEFSENVEEIVNETKL